MQKIVGDPSKAAKSYLPTSTSILLPTPYLTFLPQLLSYFLLLILPSYFLLLILPSYLNFYPTSYSLSYLPTSTSILLPTPYRGDTIKALRRRPVNQLGVIHKRRPQEWGRRVTKKRTLGGGGSSKSGRPHLVQNISIQLLDHSENHDSKKYKCTLQLMIFNFTNFSFIQKWWN